LKSESLKERTQIEKMAREAQERDERLKEMKKAKLREITEADRLEKIRFKEQMEQKLNSQRDEDDIMAKVFRQKEHEAYARRAKTDKIVATIGSKFVINDDAEQM
jgi:hypothetical protein